jgi:hypothetical protein
MDRRLYMEKDYKDLGDLPREEYLKRMDSLQKTVNPKPYTKEESDRIKNEMLSKQNR